ncbi:MAG: SpoIID/LytB domain-containing protein [Cyanobium sp.]
MLAPLLLIGVAAPVIAQRLGSPASSLPAAPQGGPPVRVLLGHGSAWELGAQPLRMRLLDGQGRPLRTLAMGERLTLSGSPAGVKIEVQSAEGGRLSLNPQRDGLWLVPLAEKDQQPFLAFGRERYRGQLQIRAGEAGQLLAINQLPLEAYLASVVGSEMPASWPQAALQAQAVAARTYALSQLRPAAAYDLKATVASQAYRGLAGETESTRAAVASTRGQVLMAQGRLIQAVFHSSSGGRTEDSGQVWSRQLPYLVSVPGNDRDAPVNRWNLRIEPDRLRALFRETGGLRSIDILESSSSGRVKLARVIGPTGTLELSGTELRQRLGLRSTLVTFALQAVPPGSTGGVIDRTVRGSVPPSAAGWPQRLPPLIAPPFLGSDPSEAPLLDSASGASPDATAPGASRVTAAAPATRPLFAAGTAMTALEPGYALLIEGRGFGHGVGMSQWGAYAMAREGRNYEQIRRHYYLGVELLLYPSP